MSSANLSRWIPFAALVSGLAWAFSGVIHYLMVFPEAGTGPVGATSYYLIEAAHTIAEAAILIVLLGLRPRLASHKGWLKRIGLASAVFGTAFLVLLTLIAVVLPPFIGEEALSNSFWENVLTISFTLGMLGTLVGFILLSILTFKTSFLPRWCAVMFLAYPLLFFLLLFLYGIGGIGLGLVWLMLGIGLRRPTVGVVLSPVG